MRRGARIRAFLPAAVLAAGAPPCVAASLDFSLEPGLFGEEALPAPLPGAPAQAVNSGLDVAVRNPLLDVAVGYDFQVMVDPSFSATDEDTSQHLAATLNSKALNRLLGVNTRVNANSVFVGHTGAYNHRVAPGFSHRVSDLAILDVNYHYQLNRPSSEAPEMSVSGYTLGLRGSLQAGKLQWNGAYSATDTFRDSYTHIQSSETLRLQSSYRVLPRMQVQLTTVITAHTRIQASRDRDFLQTQYVAGVQWTPGEHYALNFNLNRSGFSHTGEEVLLRSGTLSWFPREDLTMSLNYGDQLVDGATGVLLNTRLTLRR